MGKDSISKNGARAENVSANRLVSHDDTELFLRYKNGDNIAADILYLKNEKRIKRLAQNFAEKYKCRHIEEELFGECNLAFSEALTSFDPTIETQFFTYATTIMNRKMLNCYTKNKSCVSISRDRFRLHRVVAYHYFSDDNSSHAERLKKISVALNISTEKAEQLLSELQQNQDYIPLEEIKESAASLPETSDPFLLTYTKMRNAAIRRLPDCLRPEERDVVLRRFGLNNPDSTPESVEEIALVFAITESAVYKTLHKAYEKMKEEYKTGECAELAWIYRVLQDGKV